MDSDVWCKHYLRMFSFFFGFQAFKDINIRSAMTKKLHEFNYMWNAYYSEMQFARSCTKGFHFESTIFLWNENQVRVLWKHEMHTARDLCTPTNSTTSEFSDILMLPNNFLFGPFWKTFVPFCLKLSGTSWITVKSPSFPANLAHGHFESLHT